jgi:regulator of cell morphogenesis and NO signaling
MVTVEILDVTRIEPKYKHATIFQHFDDLEAGENFVIDNDHDPKPLYYQLLGERGNIFSWEYLEQGPRRWKVKIAKRTEGNNGETIGAIAAQDMRKAAVLKSKGIDYSCGGNKTLKEASEEAGISEEELKKSLENATTSHLTASQDMSKWKLDFLTEFITNTHHHYFKDSVEVLNGLTVKVAQHHGLNHPELNRLAQSMPTFLQNLLVHISKEERVAFPAIKQAVALKDGKQIAANAAPGLIKESSILLQKEHAIMAEDVAFIHKLTNGYKLPEDACNSYAYLYQRLQDLEEDLMQYMHIENNILFPKAVALEKELL